MYLTKQLISEHYFIIKEINQMYIIPSIIVSKDADFPFGDQTWEFSLPSGRATAMSETRGMTVYLQS